MLKRGFLLVILVLVCALASSAQESAYTPPAPQDFLGDPDAPIVIEVFSDYRCTACRAYFLGTIRSLIAEYVTVGKVCLIYRDLPLGNYRYSREAALYANAAKSIGQELEVAAALYTYQTEWSQNGDIEAVVARVLPHKAMARVRRALNDPKVKATMERGIARARDLRVRATPTSFITARGETHRIIGAVQYPILKRFLDHLLGE